MAKLNGVAAVPARWSTTILAAMASEAYQDKHGYWWLRTPATCRPLGGFPSMAALIEAAYPLYLHEIRFTQLPYGGVEC